MVLQAAPSKEVGRQIGDLAQVVEHRTENPIALVRIQEFPRKWFDSTSPCSVRGSMPASALLVRKVPLEEHFAW